MTVIERYASVLHEVLAAVFRDERDRIEQVASLAASSIAAGGVLHVFGTGHSHMIAFEAFGRAGGLAPVNAIVDHALTAFNHGRDGRLERLAGYASILLETEDLRRDEVAIVVSNSGINAVPIEFALGCKERGLTVAAITSLRHSRNSPSRHEAGLKLYEVADIVIDNHGTDGDAAVELDRSVRTGPTSTVVGAAIVNSITARMAELLIEKGHVPPVLVSQNLEGMEERNQSLLARYRDRCRLL
jgi:uncharacterized phosphosugar-binding protein